MRLGIGIDTGGTYTDAVIYDFEGQKILGSAKSLTTKADLAEGILGAIDGLPKALLGDVQLISLSTTLATNACVEDKGGRAKLIFFGGDANVIDENGAKYGLPSSADMLIQKSYTTFSGGFEGEVDWAAFERALGSGFEHLDGVGIIEMNAMRNGAVIEKAAKKIFQHKRDIPVVCGYELFSELNSLQRGASALLNAGLFPIIREFLGAVKRALSERGIHATLVIVRSDGSLMSESFAELRPVETLLCGPAASAVGGMQLAGGANNIIVDMGGTTTDIALVKDGSPVTVVDGIAIGKWKTFVDGLYIKTVGLGGDSAIRYVGDRLELQTYRITPLCIAAAKHPGMIESLQALQIKKHTHALYEHYMLVKDIAGDGKYTESERAFCEAIREKPLIVADAAAAVGKDIYSLDVKRLVKDGVVQICGLTPTDIMHIRGDFAAHATEASMLGAQFVAFNLEITVDELCDRVYDEVKRKLYMTIAEALLENKYKDYMKHGVNDDVRRLINASYEAAKAGADPLIGMGLKTDYALVGIGAPIHIFLDDVARMLGTKAVVPHYSGVANAVGAVLNSINATYTVEIKPFTNDDGMPQFRVFGRNETKIFAEIGEAGEWANAEAIIGAKEGAKARGATGELTVTTGAQVHDAAARDCTVYLGTTITARAVGSLGFS